MDSVATRRNRRWGQNFLQDPAVLMEIAEAAPIAGKRMLEIGAGHGELTRELSARVGKRGKVVALEIDETLCEGMAQLCKELGNVIIECVDALEYDFSGFKYIFGNLPYSISTPLLFKILNSDCLQSVILVQKEFGQRLVAQAGDDNYSRLSVFVQSRADAQIIEFVPKESFVPAPKVDSVVVRLVRKDKEKRFSYDEQLVRLAFCHKNQTLSNALEHSANQLKVSKKDAKKRVHQALSAWEQRKVRSITPGEWELVSKAWNG